MIAAVVPLLFPIFSFHPTSCVCVSHLGLPHKGCRPSAATLWYHIMWVSSSQLHGHASWATTYSEPCTYGILCLQHLEILSKFFTTGPFSFDMGPCKS